MEKIFDFIEAFIIKFAELPSGLKLIFFIGQLWLTMWIGSYWRAEFFWRSRLMLFPAFLLAGAIIWIPTILIKWFYDSNSEEDLF